MNAFLSGFSATLPEDEHAVMVLDGAGWHISHDLAVPANISPLRLPPYAPELNPVERVWLYLRERFLSHRLHRGIRCRPRCRLRCVAPTHPGAPPIAVRLSRDQTGHRIDSGLLKKLPSSDSLGSAMAGRVRGVGEQTT